MDDSHPMTDPILPATPASTTVEEDDTSDGVDEQSDDSFPASDPPSWSGLSL